MKSNKVVANIRKWETNFKAGMYTGLSAVADEMEIGVKLVATVDRWFNEPVERTPGDLETTYVGFVQMALGDSRYDKNIMPKNLMTYWGAKPMEIGDIISNRYGKTRTLDESEWELHHSIPEQHSVEPLPYIAKAIISSPMQYAGIVEETEYTRLPFVISLVEGQFLGIMARAITEKFK